MFWALEDSQNISPFLFGGTEKDMNKIKNSSQGFTLLELLVVVLIIGVLAAVALPQYKHIILKTKYATLKNQVKSLVQAREEYYLTHNEYPCYFDQLVITPGFTCSNAENFHSENCFQKPVGQYPNKLFSLNCGNIQTIGAIYLSSTDIISFFYNHVRDIGYKCGGNNKFCELENNLN